MLPWRARPGVRLRWVVLVRSRSRVAASRRIRRRGGDALEERPHERLLVPSLVRHRLGEVELLVGRDDSREDVERDEVGVVVLRGGGTAGLHPVLAGEGGPKRAAEGQRGMRLSREREEVARRAGRDRETEWSQVAKTEKCATGRTVVTRTRGSTTPTRR